MPQRVQPIYSDNPGSLPATYRLPPGLDLEISSIRARVNGAGAGASFIVVCETLSEDGRIMTQSEIDQTLAVGDTGAFTWAPFLRRAAAAAPPPPSGGTVQTFAAVSTTNLAAALTTLDWVSEGWSSNDGTTITVNGSGDIEIASAGTYRFTVFASSWSLTGGVSSSFVVTLNVVSGSLGNWDSRLASDEALTEGILRVNDAADTIDIAQELGPWLIGTAAWDTSASFPVVVRAQALKFEDGVPAADSSVVFRLGVQRLGDTYE